MVMGVSGCLARAALFATNRAEVHGLGGFLDLLDKRRNIEKRDRGLLTGTTDTYPSLCHAAADRFSCSIESYQYVRICSQALSGIRTAKL